MVVTDTNIAAELMRAEPSPEVLAWMDDRPPRKLFVTAVTEAEVRTGIALLPSLAYVAVRTPPLPYRLLTLAGHSG